MNGQFRLFFAGMDNSGDLYLPITLASFDAQINPSGNGVKLNWTTISENNNYGFYVERRAKSEIDFKEIANSFVSGNGTTLEPKSYSFVDNTLTTPGPYHYRLRQVDNDGLTNYSQVVSVNVSALAITETVPYEFKIYQNYPNPFNPTTTIKYEIPKTSFVSLKVYNLLGQEVAILVNEKQEAGSYDMHFDGSKLASGIYLYSLQTGSFLSTKKLLLLK
jgi:hypothetical protein